MIKKTCQHCNKEFFKPVNCSVFEWGTRKYCSHNCFRVQRGGWNAGKILSPETKEKMRQARLKNPVAKKGSEHCRWKGENVGYFALHCWLKRQLGNPKSCERCGKEGYYNQRLRNDKKVNVWNIQWANKSGEYQRNIQDWLKLCISCHKKYDLTKIK